MSRDRVDPQAGADSARIHSPLAIITVAANSTIVPNPNIRPARYATSSVMLRLGTEVLRKICTTLFDDSRGQLALLQLLRTCKRTFEPAADYLWRDLPSLAILAYLLPPDAWSAERKRDGLVSIVRQVHASDFLRLSCIMLTTSTVLQQGSSSFRLHEVLCLPSPRQKLRCESLLSNLMAHVSGCAGGAPPSCARLLLFLEPALL